MLLAVLALALYAARKVVVRDALVGWLHARGIAAEAEVDSLGLSSAVARVRIGDPRAPDFTADRVEVRYGRQGLGFEVTAVTLRRPVLRARWHDGRLSLGALDPLIAEFRRKPPRPGAAKPTIAVDDGLLLLATDSGPLRLIADARVQEDKLLAADVRSAPARLQGSGFDISLGAGMATARTAGGRVVVTLDAPILHAAAEGLLAEQTRLQVKAALPYPDLARQRGDGAVVVQANLAGGRVALSGQSFEGADLSAAFTGQAQGWIPDLTVRGRGVADLRAAAGAFGAGRAAGLRAAAVADDLVWSRRGGDAVSATLAVNGGLDSLAAGGLRLQAVTAAARGSLAANRQGATLRLSASALGHGAWSGLGAPTAEDSAEIAAVKRAAAGFRFAAPGVVLAVHGAGPRLALSQPLRLIPDQGGAVTLAAAGSGWRLTSAGGGLPAATAEVARFALTPGGAVAEGHVRAALGVGPIRRGLFDAAGTLRLADGGLAFEADRCVRVQAGRLELGVNDVTDLSGALCPAGRPLLTLGGGDWRIAGRGQGIAASVPFLQAKVAGASGAAEFGQRAGRLDAAVRIAAAQVSDTAAATRFRPLALTGRADLAGEVWRADLRLAAEGHPVATASLTHDGRSGVGEAVLDTGELAFAEGGLQPGQLSPLAAAVGSPATGRAHFTGRFGWSPAGATSSGVLETQGLDFRSAAGPVTGLAGRLVFTSLAPLAAAPGQTVRVARIAALAPLTDLTTSVGLDAAGLHLRGGEAAVGGGLLRLASLDLPLGADAPVRGEVELEGVQLHDLLEASPFGDRVDLDAKVSGRIPFTAEDAKVRIAGGTLHAIQPGRLSIRPTALSGVSAAGSAAKAPAAAAAPAPRDTITDFAYQAMENLAFDTLEASVDSRPDGRLGVLFHIVGRHDPPQRQVLRVPLADLIRRSFMNRELPLPSDTGVNLTLDTTVNLDDLLQDYADYQRLRSSAPVQP